MRAGPDKAEVSGSSPLRPTPTVPSHLDFHGCDSEPRNDPLVEPLQQLAQIAQCSEFVLDSTLTCEIAI